MRAARGGAQQLLLPAAAGGCGGTRASEAARPHFHRQSRLRQPPAAGDAFAGGNFGRPPARPAADAEARAVGGQAKAEHQQATSRARRLPVPQQGFCTWSPSSTGQLDECCPGVVASRSPPLRSGSSSANSGTNMRVPAWRSQTPWRSGPATALWSWSTRTLF